jgi:ubiquinone/menaquinone biosynthesis C-methylase UbiE
MTCGPYEIFDSLAEQYDAWYDTPGGQSLFAAEVECLRPFVARLAEPILEIGVGTGRFAEALGVSHGVDPAPRPLAIAASRGVETKCAPGEDLPYDDESFGGGYLRVHAMFRG